MFKNQFRMAAAVEELCSRLCYGGLLQNDVSTRLVRRGRSRDALRFIQDEFGVTSEYPDLFRGRDMWPRALVHSNRGSRRPMNHLMLSSSEPPTKCLCKRYAVDLVNAHPFVQGWMYRTSKHSVLWTENKQLPGVTLRLALSL